jgi:hypothetical protein
MKPLKAAAVETRCVKLDADTGILACLQESEPRHWKIAVGSQNSTRWTGLLIFSI